MSDISEVDLAWCAGFFDGEGYVTISRRNHKGYTGHYLRVGINHVAPEPLYKFVELFGGKLEYDDKCKGNRKPRYRWAKSTSSALSVLEQLEPYLLNKQNVVKIAREFQNTMTKSTKKLSDEVIEFRESCKLQMMAVNAAD